MCRLSGECQISTSVVSIVAKNGKVYSAALFIVLVPTGKCWTNTIHSLKWIGKKPTDADNLELEILETILLELQDMKPQRQIKVEKIQALFQNVVGKWNNFTAKSNPNISFVRFLYWNVQGIEVYEHANMLQYERREEFLTA